MIVGSFRDSWDMCKIPQTFLGFLGYVRDLSNIFEIFEKFVGSLKDFFGITMGSLRDFWDHFANLMSDLGDFRAFFHSWDRSGIVLPSVSGFLRPFHKLID